MSKKTKIIFAIVGGAVVGALGVCATIWPTAGMLFASASALVAMVVATLTGFSVTKES